MADQHNPQLIYLEAHLAEKDLAALYRSCQFGVYPYRAEGFGYPILESMACGTPCLVPNFGACLDFCAEGNAIFVEHQTVNLPIDKEFTYNSLGYQERLTEVHFSEVRPEALAREMRAAFEMNSISYQSLAANAANTARRFSWYNTAKEISRILNESR
jgi:glycosyltransferase involved in cell wall biosynthesis